MPAAGDTAGPAQGLICNWGRCSETKGCRLTKGVQRGQAGLALLNGKQEAALRVGMCASWGELSVCMHALQEGWGWGGEWYVCVAWPPRAPGGGGGGGGRGCINQINGGG